MQESGPSSRGRQALLRGVSRPVSILTAARTDGPSPLNGPLARHTVNRSLKTARGANKIDTLAGRTDISVRFNGTSHRQRHSHNSPRVPHSYYVFSHQIPHRSRQRVEFSQPEQTWQGRNVKKNISQTLNLKLRETPLDR